MKKYIAALMTVFFLGSTTGLIYAQGSAPATTPAAKTVTKTSHKKHNKKAKGNKKGKPAPAAAATTPVAK